LAKDVKMEAQIVALTDKLEYLKNHKVMAIGRTRGIQNGKMISGV